MRKPSDFRDSEVHSEDSIEDWVSQARITHPAAASLVLSSGHNSPWTKPSDLWYNLD